MGKTKTNNFAAKIIQTYEKAKPMKKNNLMKKLFVLSIALTLFCTGNTFAMDIRKSSGNLECAYVEWQTVSGAARYNVYY